jgi:hypothetical protein
MIRAERGGIDVNEGRPPSTPVAALPTAQVNLALFASTTSGAFADVPGMALAVATAGGTFLELFFDVTFTSDSPFPFEATGQFRLMIDGVEVTRCGESVAATSFIDSASAVWRTPAPLAAGAHVVKVQWRAINFLAGTTIQVDPTDTVGATEHHAQRMTLVVNEVAA